MMNLPSQVIRYGISKIRPMGIQEPVNLPDFPSSIVSKIAIVQMSELDENGRIKSNDNKGFNVLIEGISIPLTTTVDNNTLVVYGLNLKLYPNERQSIDSRTLLAVMNTVIQDIFLSFSTTNADRFEQLRLILRNHMPHRAKISFITFYHPSIQHIDVKDIDQHQELLNMFTPQTEQPQIINKGALDIDLDLLSYHIVVLYDNQLKNTGTKEMTHLAMVSSFIQEFHRPNVKTSTTKKTDDEDGKIKTESNLTFRDFVYKQKLNETVDSQIKSLIEKQVRQMLNRIEYSNKNNHVHFVVDDVPYDFDDLNVLDWNTLRNNLSFKQLFSNENYALSININDNVATITPSSFEINL